MSFNVNQSYSELRLPGQCSTYLYNDSWVQTFPVYMQFIIYQFIPVNSL